MSRSYEFVTEFNIFRTIWENCHCCSLEEALHNLREMIQNCLTCKFHEKTSLGLCRDYPPGFSNSKAIRPLTSWLYCSKLIQFSDWLKETSQLLLRVGGKKRQKEKCLKFLLTVSIAVMKWAVKWTTKTNWCLNFSLLACRIRAVMVPVLQDCCEN